MDTTVEVFSGTCYVSDSKNDFGSLEANQTYHINFPIMLFNSGTQKEGKEQFVLLKQWSADIGIETEGKEVVDVQNSLLYVIGLYKTKQNQLS